jgi:hypothetical protein
MQTLIKTGLFLLALAAVMVGVSYNVIKAQDFDQSNHHGKRTLATETRTLTPGIVAIDLNGPIDLVLKQGATPALTVRAEQRMLPKIETIQNGDTLHIDTKGLLLHTNRSMRVEVTIPALQKLLVSGSGDSKVSGFSGEQLQLALHGSGDVVLNGQYRHINVSVTGSGDLKLDAGTSDNMNLNLTGSGEISTSGQSKVLIAKLTGSGDLNARQLQADTVNLTLHGSGDSSVFAKQSANLTLSGSGDISVYGKPAQRKVNNSGSGEIIWE